MSPFVMSKRCRLFSFDRSDNWRFRSSARGKTMHAIVSETLLELSSSHAHYSHAFHIDALFYCLCRRPLRLSARKSSIIEQIK